MSYCRFPGMRQRERGAQLMFSSHLFGPTSHPPLALIHVELPLGCCVGGSFTAHRCSSEDVLVLLQGIWNCRGRLQVPVEVGVEKVTYAAFQNNLAGVVVAVSFLVEEARYFVRCSVMVSVPGVILADHLSCICHFILVLKPAIHLCDFKGQPRTSTVSFRDVRHP